MGEAETAAEQGRAVRGRVLVRESEECKHMRVRLHIQLAGWLAAGPAGFP